jgi:hypothetical protein
MAPHALVILVFVVGAFFAHEFGHALVAQFFGARSVTFHGLGMQLSILSAIFLVRALCN